jgi:hypothetical protein
MSMDLKEQFFIRYFEIIKDIEKEARGLSLYYDEYTECRIKCNSNSACCNTTSKLFPIEIQALKHK